MSGLWPSTWRKGEDTPPAVDTRCCCVHNAVAVAAYWITPRPSPGERTTPVGGGFHTEELDKAMHALDTGKFLVRLVKAWRLPDGRLALRDPTSAGVPIGRPYPRKSDV